MASDQHLSLEPLPIFANDGKDSDLFAKPARLQDVVLQDGSQVYTRNDPKKTLQDRLIRVWAERGDYSLITEEKVRNPVEEEEETTKQDPEGRPSPEEMRKLAETMLNNLTIARGELSTALDLLNVLSPATDPPNVDPNTIPLPHETLRIVSTSIPPPPSYTDPSLNPLAALPLASSLSSLKQNANSFFSASEDLIPLESTSEELSSPSFTPRKRTKASIDPWPVILSLHSQSPSRTLLPLGALPGATLTGKSEGRSARQVGIFYGFQEAASQYRRASVAAIGELVHPEVERGGGRKLCIELNEGERVVWEDHLKEVEEEEENEGVEGILKRRNRSAFAEEMFARLVGEVKGDGTLGKYKVGNQTMGESIEVNLSNGDNLTISMISPTSKLSSTSPASSSPITLISPLFRLLFLKEYSSRRRPSQIQPRPLLPTISTFLSYLHRIESLKALLRRLKTEREEEEVEIQVELWSGDRKLSLYVETKGQSSGDVLRVLEGKVELGGRALVKINHRHSFHILHSLPLPQATSSTTTQTYHTQSPKSGLLTLRCPGKLPITIPSLRHLEEFLKGEVERVLAKEKGKGTK
ncbi:hypothetical protein JCM5353_008614 [Sporobolomyces roseus]